MNEIDFVSVGLCVRNGEKYLREALDSLLLQKHKNFELIISDNASTDGTQKICEEYVRKDKRIRYVCQKENLGSFGNYDFVKSQAKGDYFMYATDDDWWHPRFIEWCLRELKEHPEAFLAFPDFYTFDDVGKKMRYDRKRYFPFARGRWRLVQYAAKRSRYGKSTMLYGLQRNVPTPKFDDYKSDVLYVYQLLKIGYFVPAPGALFWKRLPTYGERKGEMTVDEWIENRRKYLPAIQAVKEFIADKIQGLKYLWGYLS